MKKFENVYQDAALMRKVLLGEADEVEQKDLEKRLAECPDLRNVYEQLQSGETLENIKNIRQRKLISLFFRVSGRWNRKAGRVVLVGWGGTLLRLSLL